jgi:hypothetical protein
VRNCRRKGLEGHSEGRKGREGHSVRRKERVKDKGKVGEKRRGGKR